jgi:Transposase DDE domain
VGGRAQPLDLPPCLARDSRAGLEKSILLGTRDRVAARLIAVRMPDALVTERRRQARAVAKKRGSTPSQAQLTLLAWNLFITKVPAPVWPLQTVASADSLRWQVELVFKSWKSPLPLATLTTTTKNSTLCYLYGRLGLSFLPYALCPTLRAPVGQKPQRELSLLKLVRHFQAGADQWLSGLFPSPPGLAAFLSRACAAAERLVRKAVRKHHTSAQRLRDSLGPQVDFFEPALALVA